MNSLEAFGLLDLRVGTIISANDFPEARKPAFILKIDFGKLGVLKSSAQITEKYSLGSLIGKQVIAVVNFPKKQIGPIQSECLVLGLKTEMGVVLLQPEAKVENGIRVS